MPPALQDLKDGAAKRAGKVRGEPRCLQQEMLRGASLAAKGLRASCKMEEGLGGSCRSDDSVPWYGGKSPGLWERSVGYRRKPEHRVGWALT